MSHASYSCSTPIFVNSAYTYTIKPDGRCRCAACPFEPLVYASQHLDQICQLPAGSSLTGFVGG